MSGERVVIHHLSGDGLRGRSVDTARLVDADQFFPFKIRLLFKFDGLAGEVRLLRIRLGADRDIFTCGHGHSSGHKSCRTCKQHLSATSGCGSHANNQTGGRDYSVVRAENCCAKPSYVLCPVPLTMEYWHYVSLSMSQVNRWSNQVSLVLEFIYLGLFLLECLKKSESDGENNRPEYNP